MGARAALPRIVSPLGRRAFVVVDPFLATTPAFREAVAALEASGIETHVHTDVLPELPVDSLQASAEAARAVRPDVVIGYGGGSALDASKLVALLLAHGGALPDYYGENAVPGPVLPLVAVPTTAGTGSEVTPVAVVADPARAVKVGISSPYLIPTAALVDPELSAAAPAGVTAHAGIDALVHAVESFTGRPLEPTWSTTPPVFVGRNLLTEPLSLEAIRLIGTSIESAVTHPTDRTAREDMARGSLLAGMAFGPTGTHLSHALQYPIGALTHTPHGLGTGLMLPYVLAACAAAIPEQLALVGQALGVDGSAQVAIRRIADIDRAIGLPHSLQDIGLTREQLPGIAELALGSARLIAITPVPVDAALLERILEAAWSGDLASLLD
ncbi:alcohol dehydrogenase [Pseudolysinimonas kribbensis]|uniref:Alcohol dehydrogenase n=1 Tax=Pseudolysinimonas kribbensis TaxID=433641 RepID=A0ABQ6K9Y5_9MICO|nr:iron-containing alcohol dehydrogenase [Pseudolysinimonas kribbensis]GMA95511.1 alcohol dehydrogenase [Pseudolysinimonas kribbensis]